MRPGVAARPFGAGDADALLRMHRDCLRHYRVDPAPAAVERELLRELEAPFGTMATLAWSDVEPIGFASSVRVPAGPGFALYLKELYVTAGARGLGAGRVLMRAVAGQALALGARRLQWETGEEGARRFYARLGAPPTGKTHYAVTADDLRTFAA